MTLIFYVALIATVFSIAALLLAPAVLKPSPIAQRMMDLVQSNRPDRRVVHNKERVQGVILTAAMSLRRRLGLSEDAKVKQRLMSAGVRSSRGADAYFASRLVAPVAGLIVGSAIHHNTTFWAFALAAVCYMLPDIWLTRRMAKRRGQIRKGIPDALDLLVICVGAGLGIDQAILRVGEEIKISHPELNTEFMQINFEQRAGKPRMDALKSAADRTQVTEFALFVTMLIQADKFGTPLIRALSRFSDEIRQKRRQMAEEKAAKTKVKILFPLVLFIFPCIFVVLLGPAIINISRVMTSFK